MWRRKTEEPVEVLQRLDDIHGGLLDAMGYLMGMDAKLDRILLLLDEDDDDGEEEENDS